MIAAAADREWDGTSVVLSPIPVGIAPYHGRFPGTLSISPETLRRYARDIVDSLSSSCSSLDTVVFVNEHGGNGETL
nr:creatininase family protein [Natrialba asiatica]